LAAVVNLAVHHLLVYIKITYGDKRYEGNSSNWVLLELIEGYWEFHQRFILSA
jgi:hypothetical protein